jgi:uncharacterized coiled-coil protein SlyX
MSLIISHPESAMRPWNLSLLVLALTAGCSAAPLDSTATSVPASAAPESSTVLAGEDAGEVNRQIIYQATLVLHVEDFAAAEREVAALVKATGGYIAQFRDERPYGAVRGGHWTVRVPVPEFERFVEETSKLGVAERRDLTSQDVTEEHVDLTARLKNKQQLEARLLELVAKRGDEIKDILALEAELSRVREEIERMQGRLRYLADRVKLTTVEITAYERHDYRPPEATLVGRIEHTLTESLDMLRQVSEALLLLVVALLPWLAALTILAVPPILLLRRALRRRRARVVTAEAI